MNRFLKRLWADQAGATAIEYALIAALIAVGLIASLDGVREALIGVFGEVVAALGGA